MMQVQAPGRVLNHIRHQLAGGHWILKENGFKKFNPVLLPAVGI